MPFIGPGPGAPTVEMLMRQIDHAIKVCGVDHVGIGSDLSTDAHRGDAGVLKRGQGVRRRPRRARHLGAGRRAAALHSRAESSRRIEGVVRGLRQRESSGRDVIEKIIGGNFHRVFKEIWTM